MEQHLCLFNTEAYHRLYLQPPQTYLRIDYREEGRLIGSCAGILEDGVFDCGHRAPFGGIDISGEYQSPGKLNNLVRYVLDQARLHGATRIRIHCRPHYIGPCESAIQFALLAQKFAVEYVEVSQGILLSGVSNEQTYVDQLRSPGRRALRHSLQLGLHAGFAEKEEEWTEGFEVVEKNRARRGLRLKYSLAYLHQLRALFPGQIRMLVLRHLSSVVASALVYRVLPGVHYVAAWGDAGHDLSYSPMNHLAHHVVLDALKDGIYVVDLGLSSIDGEANDGLVQFKRNVGASTGMRLDLVSDL